MGEFLYADMLQHCAAALFRIDLNHRVTNWNRACEKLTGIRADAVIGTDMHWHAFFSSPRPCLSDLIIDGKTAQIADLYPGSCNSLLLDDGWHAEGWYGDPDTKQRYLTVDAGPVYAAGSRATGNGDLVAAVETLYDVTPLKVIEEKNARLAAELQRSLTELKVAGGLLSICAACKKVKDDQGYWTQIEHYISEHAEIEFTHGICPECTTKLYPGLSWSRRE